MTKKFPDWTPKGLLKFIENSDGNDDQYTQLAHRLILYPDMRYVWPELEKRRSHLAEGMQNVDVGDILITCVIGCLNNAQQQIERNERLELYKDIKSSGSNFISLIKEVNLDASVNEMYEALTNKSEWFGLESWMDDQRYINNNEPLLSDAINYILNFVQTSIDDIEREKHVLPYKNSKNAQRIAFIRYLGFFFKANFGQFMYRTIATVTRATLDEEDIDENMVRDALKKRGG